MDSSATTPQRWPSCVGNCYRSKKKKTFATSSASSSSSCPQRAHDKCFNCCRSLVISLIVAALIVVYSRHYFYSVVNASLPATGPRRLVCYYRCDIPFEAKIPQTLCTHIILGFAYVGSDSALNLTSVGGLRGIKRRVASLQRIGGPRVMLSIGSTWQNDQFPTMVSTESNIQKFIDSCLHLMNETGLDGIDIDWEFPSWFERGRLANFLAQTESRFRVLAGAKKRLLSIAVPASIVMVFGFSGEALNRYCDFVNVMTYDIVLSKWPLMLTALHSALYPENILYSFHTVAFAVDFWIFSGISRSKFNIGIPTYGVAYELKNPQRSDLLAPINGFSKLGSNVDYQWICQTLSSASSISKRADNARVPILNDGNGTWVTYDDIWSVREKVLFARDKAVGGLMVFSLNADDPENICQQGRFPLTNEAHKYFFTARL